MAVCPTFVDRVNIALAEDTALVFLGAPGGNIVEGEVQQVEVLRLVMTFKMLKQASAIFNAKVREIEAAQRKNPVLLRVQEPQTFGADADDQNSVAPVLQH